MAVDKMLELGMGSPTNICVLQNIMLLSKHFYGSRTSRYIDLYSVVHFLSQVIFVFPLFFGMVIYTNEVETKEK